MNSLFDEFNTLLEMIPLKNDIEVTNYRRVYNQRKSLIKFVGDIFFQIKTLIKHENESEHNLFSIHFENYQTKKGIIFYYLKDKKEIFDIRIGKIIMDSNKVNFINTQSINGYYKEEKLLSLINSENIISLEELRHKINDLMMDLI